MSVAGRAPGLTPGPEPGPILRMKFIGALGLASTRAKRPAGVVEGGKGGCGWLCVRLLVVDEAREYANGAAAAPMPVLVLAPVGDERAQLGGKMGRLGWRIKACIRRETSCW